MVPNAFHFCGGTPMGVLFSLRYDTARASDELFPAGRIVPAATRRKLVFLKFPGRTVRQFGRKCDGVWQPPSRHEP